MCFGSQSPVFPPTNQHQFFLAILPHSVIWKLFLRSIILRGASHQFVLGKQLPWSRSSLSNPLTSGMPPYFLICTQSGRVAKDSTSHGMCAPNEQLYPLDIECVLLVNNCLVRGVFVANPQVLFQVSTSVAFHSFYVAKSFKARFVYILSQRIFSRQTPGANPAFIDVVELWGAKVSTYNDEALDCIHRNEPVLASCLGLAISAGYMRVLM